VNCDELRALTKVSIKFAFVLVPLYYIEFSSNFFHTTIINKVIPNVKNYFKLITHKLTQTNTRGRDAKPPSLRCKSPKNAKNLRKFTLVY